VALRPLLGVAAVLALAGCGSTVERARGPVAPDAQAPPITAADSPPPPDALFFLKSDFGATEGGGSTRTVVLCAQWSGSSDATGGGAVGGTVDSASPPRSNAGGTCPQPGAAALARLRAQQRRFQHAIRPAPASPPRVVARLPLDGGGETLFIAWKTSSGALCFEVDEVDPHGGGAGGPGGPCARAAQDTAAAPSVDLTGLRAPCDALCLESQGGSSGDAAAPTTYRLGGTVAADAEALRVTTDDGAVATYPLVGPVLPDTNARVFMLDLGTHDWRKLELVRGGDVVETGDMPAFQAAAEDCSKSIGPPPMPRESLDQQALETLMQPYDDAFRACMKTAAPPHP
jgi:hypothetical protein